jgi:hypothetical protein
MTAQAQQKGRQKHQMHGLYALKGALMRVGYRAVDGRTSTGKALAKWRQDLITDLGGDVSTQESAIIDLAVKSKLLLDSIDVWLLSQSSLVNMRKRSLIPVVKERQALADGLARYLSMLGLARRAKDTDNLETYIREKYGNRGGEIEQETMQCGRGDQDSQLEADHVAEGMTQARRAKIDGESGT